MQLFILTTFTLIVLFGSIACQRRGQSRLPLIDSEGSRYKSSQSSRVNSCLFGNQTYEINERWKPNLGGSIGTLYCVRCECAEVNRKSHTKIATRVKCRNIKHDCPKPDCEDAVLLPERCCKTCPGTQEDGNFEDDLAGRSIKRQGHEGKRIYAMVGKPNKSGTTSTSSTSTFSSTSTSSMTPLELMSPSVTSVASQVSTTSVSSLGITGKEPTGTLMDDHDTDHQTNDISSSHKCYYEGQIFEDGSQWKAQHEECQMCSCVVSHTITLFLFSLTIL